MSLPFSTTPSLIDLPWSILGMGLGVCLVLTTVGFRRVEYFVSLGYAASVAGLALLLPLIYGHAVTGWALVQSVLLLAYGLRLGGFILLRSRTASFEARPQADLGPLGQNLLPARRKGGHRLRRGQSLGPTRRLHHHAHPDQRPQR